jgi:hypothetical protein
VTAIVAAFACEQGSNLRHNTIQGKTRPRRSLPNSLTQYSAHQSHDDGTSKGPHRQSKITVVIGDAVVAAFNRFEVMGPIDGAFGMLPTSEPSP